jgi:hypothetical protein
VLAQEDRRSLEWQSRLVAAFHVLTTDAQIAIYDGKYTYVFWRPVTAIRTGAVAPDPAWTPLIATPRHPEYPAGHAGYAGAAAAVLEGLVGKRPAAPITITSSTDPGFPRTYETWATFARENVDARVWEGIHYRHTQEVSAELGRTVAEYGLKRLDALGLR